MSSPNFKSILTTKAREVEPTKLIPAGTYMISIGNFVCAEIGQTKKKRIDVSFKILMPHTDVSDSEIEAVGGIEGIKKIRPPKIQFWVEDEDGTKTLNNIMNFFKKSAKIEVSDDETIEELLLKCVGCQVNAEITHTFDRNDSSKIYANVGKVFALEE